MTAGAFLLLIATTLLLRLDVLTQIIDQPPRLLRSLDGSQCLSPWTIRVRTDSASDILNLELSESTNDFLPADFKLESGFKSMNSRPCFYQGVVIGSDGLVAAKVDDGMISATFSHNDTVYEVPSQEVWRSELHATVLQKDGISRKCGLLKKSSSATLSRGRRSVVKADTNSLVAPTDRRYIQMILVGDFGFYIGMNKSVTKATSRLWEIANFVNGLYKQVGANVITVRTIVWTTDVLAMTNASQGVNASLMLDKFIVYRMQALNDTSHAVAHLVTGFPMTDGIVGLANLGKLCLFTSAAAVNWDNRMNSSSYSVAVTVAHELGHNLGMEHDDDRENVTCPCPDPQGCLMAAGSAA